MIASQRVDLLPFDEKFLDCTRKWINDPEVRRGTGSEGPVSDYEHRKWYERLMSDRAQRVFVIAEKGGGQLPVGLIGLKGIDPRSRAAEYWIYIGEGSARRKGLASEATIRILDYGFNTLNLHRISLAVLETNMAAIALYKKLGFVYEGTARDERFQEGRFTHTLYFSLLDQEFREQHQNG